MDRVSILEAELKTKNKEIQRLRIKAETNINTGIKVDTFLVEAKATRENQKIIALKSQLELLRKDKIGLEATILSLRDQLRLRSSSKIEISSYKTKITDLEKKIEEYGLLLRQKNHELQEATRLHKLELIRVKDVQKISIENGNNQKIRSLQSLVSSLSEENQVLQKRIQEATASIEVFKAEKHSLTLAVEETSLQKIRILEKKQANEIASYKAELLEANTKFLAAEKLAADTKAQYQAIQKQFLSISTELGQANNQLGVLRGKVSDLEISISAKVQEISELKTSIGVISQVRTDAEARVLELTTKIESLQVASLQITQLQDQIKKLETEKLAIISQKESYLSRITTLETEVHKKEQLIVSEGSNKAVYEAQINTLRDKITGLQLLIEQKTIEIEEAKRFEDDYHKILSKNNLLEIELQNLEEEKRSNLVLINNLQTTIKEKETLVVDIQQKLVTATTKIEQENRAVVTNEAILTHLNEKIDRKELMIIELREKLVQRDARNTDLEDKLVKAEQETRQLEARISIQVRKIQEMQDLVASLEASKNELLLKIENTRDISLSHHTTVRELNERIQYLNTEITSLETKLKLSKETVISISREKEVLRTQLKEKSDEWVLLNSEKERIALELEDIRAQIEFRIKSENEKVLLRIESRK